MNAAISESGLWMCGDWLSSISGSNGWTYVGWGLFVEMSMNVYRLYFIIIGI